MALEKAYWFEVYVRRPVTSEDEQETPEMDAFLDGLTKVVQEAAEKYRKEHPEPVGIGVDVDTNFSSDTYEKE